MTNKSRKSGAFDTQNGSESSGSASGASAALSEKAEAAYLQDRSCSLSGQKDKRKRFSKDR
ncbi:hypothetical protein KIN20_016648 [Parelaphostrongylus tenuis]|uniref:Uncharacterized protein n=1 Tax=Parelaphostrongylus tenuis TaxID=148309 RepID=A0AAD5MGR7_PARTN|nr:hypothetical protein KIN20_016648 [Parelaphostrongylus tenuis]